MLIIFNLTTCIISITKSKLLERQCKRYKTFANNCVVFITIDISSYVVSNLEIICFCELIMESIKHFLAKHSLSGCSSILTKTVLLPVRKMARRVCNRLDSSPSMNCWQFSTSRFNILILISRYSNSDWQFFKHLNALQLQWQCILNE